MKMPTKKQIGAVLEFLPVLKRPDLSPSKWHGDWKAKDGVISLPLEEDSAEISNLISALYDNGFVEDFDWMPWQTTAEPYIANTKLVDEAALETLKTLLITHVRYDHFCDGHFSAMIKSGQITAILERLAVLEKNMKAG
jgi:Family of unknown function (DUF6508)